MHLIRQENSRGNALYLDRVERYEYHALLHLAKIRTAVKLNLFFITSYF